MSTIEKSITVNQPVSTVYNQWTQFETFPKFMEGVEEIKQTTDTMTHWTTNIGGVRREFDAEIVEQQPDERIGWHAVDGPKQDGMVTFQPAGPNSTQITVRMDYEPEGLVEKAGDALNIIDRRVDGDLKRFKKFIEERGTETGAWRGSV